MSRHLLIPNIIKSDDSFDSFRLLLTEGLHGKTTQLDLPKGMVQNFLAGENSSKRKSLQHLLTQLAKNDISRNKDGLFTYGSKVLDIDYDDFIRDSCSGNFSNHYEPI